ncbi:MAG: site-2 protease family protein [Veillonellaceae bacterium]|nr:site-2 protease family protein [Veillonellaceae bacterium]
MFDFSLTGLIAGLPGLVIALVIHEYAHAKAADVMGDFTPRMTGRLTLNPMAHIDPIGLIMLLVVRFGWAKPVMINARNFRNWRQGELLVAVAGPVANLLVAFISLLAMAVLFKLGMFSEGVRLVLSMMVLFNINFAIFNMLPLPPLDGSKVLMVLLPGRLAYKLMSLERYSFIILIFLMMTPFLTMILIPLQRLVLSVFNLIIGVII